MGPPSRAPLSLVPPPKAGGDRARPDATLHASVDATPEATLDSAFRSYSAYVAYIGVRILGQDDEIDDLVQDVFVEAVRGLGRLKDAGAVKGWLGTVTVRVASRKLVVRRLRRFLRLDDAPAYEAMVWPGADPEQCATLARIYRLLDRVPAKHRIAWILRMVEGEPVDEVARLCNCSRATAKRWVEAVQSTIEREMGHA